MAANSDRNPRHIRMRTLDLSRSSRLNLLGSVTYCSAGSALSVLCGRTRSGHSRGPVRAMGARRSAHSTRPSSPSASSWRCRAPRCPSPSSPPSPLRYTSPSTPSASTPCGWASWARPSPTPSPTLVQLLLALAYLAFLDHEGLRGAVLARVVPRRRLPGLGALPGARGAPPAS